MQYPIHYNSKENIRARLLQSAADFWGIRSTADLDPMVRLLIEALAGELYNLANDLKNTESRLLTKLAALLTPDLLTSALPAHALMQALPVEASEQLTEFQHFVHTPRRQQGEQTPDIFFTPALPVNIHDVNIVHLATGNQLYMFDPQRGKMLIGAGTKHLAPQSIYIGLRINEKLQQLKGFSLYIDWKHHEFPNDWYQLLALCRGYINGQEVPLQHGLHGVETTHQTLAHTLSFDTMPVLVRDAIEFYNHHYLSFADNQLNPKSFALHPYPPEFTNVFRAQELAPLQDGLLWLQLTFPAAIQQHLLDNVEVHTNAFPVLNRRLHKLQHRFKGIGNIIPVKPGEREFFLSVHKLSDSRGHQYLPVSYGEQEEVTQGSYSVRTGGAERFDSRNAKEMISYLFELLRDESAAFSAYGYDFLTDVLKKMQQNLALVEQKAKYDLNAMTDSTRYVIVKPQHAVEVMHLEYWTTQGEASVALRTGAPLIQFEGSGTRGETLQLLTRPTGGRKSADSSNLLQAYKYGLMTRDRIVTEDDISNFCQHELGNRTTGITVRRGVMVSPHPKEGLKKTTDIIIQGTPNHPFTLEEWEFTSRQLLQKLKTRSSVLTHYRLLLA